MKFKCLKCGYCCRNLIIKAPINDHTVKLGLFLMPSERKLFPLDQIKPMYGAGIKGRSRPRPKVVSSYQFSGNVCLHLTKDNLCRIYDSRPISCKEYPLEFGLKPIISLGINPCCSWKKKYFPDYQIGDALPKGSVDLSELIQYMRVVLNYLQRFPKKYDVLWMYDLDTNRWCRSG